MKQFSEIKNLFDRIIPKKIKNNYNYLRSLYYFQQIYEAVYEFELQKKSDSLLKNMFEEYLSDNKLTMKVSFPINDGQAIYNKTIILEFDIPNGSYNCIYREENSTVDNPNRFWEYVEDVTKINSVDDQVNVTENYNRISDIGGLEKTIFSIFNEDGEELEKKITSKSLSTGNLLYMEYYKCSPSNYCLASYTTRFVDDDRYDLKYESREIILDNPSFNKKFDVNRKLENGTYNLSDSLKCQSIRFIKEISESEYADFLAAMSQPKFDGYAKLLNDRCNG